MPTAIKPAITGDLVFFTVALADRRRTLLVDHVPLLREAVREVHFDHPFGIVGWVVLPNHMHAVWQMPAGDRAYGQRWGAIKSKFTRSLRRRNIIQPEEMRHAKEVLGHAGVWKPGFLHHPIRDAQDQQDCVLHCWHDPVRHGIVQDPHDWPFSSIHRDQPRRTMAAE